MLQLIIEWLKFQYVENSSDAYISYNKNIILLKTLYVGSISFPKQPILIRQN